MVPSDIMYVKLFMFVVGKQLSQYLLKCALRLSSWRLKCYYDQRNVVQMLSQCNEMFFEEMFASYENLMTFDHRKRTRSLSYGS